MHDAPLGVIKENISTKLLREIKLINKQHNTNNNIDKVNSKKNKEINLLVNNKKEYQNKINKYSEYQKNIQNSIEFNNKKNSNTPLLLPKQNKIFLNNDAGKYFNNNFVKSSKNKNIQNHISPSFDYNIKNNKKNSNMKLNLKNNNSKPIKLKDNEIEITYHNNKKNKNNKQHLFSSASMEIKVSSSSISLLDSHRDKKKYNSISRKNSKKKDNTDNNYNINFNKNIRKYISFTPGPPRQANYIKNKSSSINNSENRKIKDEIISIFERKINQKMNTKNSKKNKNNSSHFITKISRNRLEENKKIINSKSQKILSIKEKQNDEISNNNKFEALNIFEKKMFTENNKSKSNYEKYRSLLESKIIKLIEDIKNLKNEEKDISSQLINYKDMEQSCNEVRKMREDINRFKIVIETAFKACEEYNKEIKKIKNIIGEDSNNKE